MDLRSASLLLLSILSLTVVEVHAQITIEDAGSFGVGLNGDVDFDFDEDLTVIDNYLYVTANDQVHQYMIDDVSGSLTYMQAFGTETDFLFGASEITHAGDLLFIGGFGPHVRIYDVSDPATPVARGGIDVSILRQPLDMVARNGTLFLIPDFARGPAPNADLLVYDYTDPDNPELTTTYQPQSDTPSNLFWPENSDILFLTVATGLEQHYLELVDVSDPAAPTQLSLTATAGIPTLVRVDGTTAYVGNRITRDSGWILEAFDVSDPANPVQLGSMNREDEGVMLDFRISPEGNLVAALHLAGVRVFSFDGSTFTEEASLAETSGLNDMVLFESSDATGKLLDHYVHAFILSNLKDFWGDDPPLVGGTGFSSGAGKIFKISEHLSCPGPHDVTIEKYYYLSFPFGIFPLSEVLQYYIKEGILSLSFTEFFNLFNQTSCDAISSPDNPVDAGTTVTLEQGCSNLEWEAVGWYNEVLGYSTSSLDNFIMPCADVLVDAVFEVLNLQIWLSELGITPNSSLVPGSMNDFEDGDTDGTRFGKTAGSLEVVAEAAMNGTSLGLAVHVDNASPAVVMDDTPEQDTFYGGFFYFDPNEVDLGRQESHKIMTGLMGDTDELFSIHLRRSNDQYQIKGATVDNDGIMFETDWTAIADSANAINLIWQAGLAPDSQRGRLTLIVNGVIQAILRGFDNDALQLDLVQYGLVDVDGLGAESTGTEYFDEYAAISFSPDPTLTSTETEEQPDNYVLFGNYPNPFNPTTLLRYHVPRPTTVSIDIFDTTGRLVTTLVHGHQPAGVHEAVWNAEHQASGIYYARMRAESAGTVQFEKTKKMVLLR